MASVVLSNAHDVFAVPLQIQFDPKVLQLVNVDAGGLLGGDGQPVALVHRDEGNGLVTISASRPPGVGGVNGQGQVCMLTFKAIGAGDTNIALVKVGAKNSIQANLPAVGFAGRGSREVRGWMRFEVQGSRFEGPGTGDDRLEARADARRNLRAEAGLTLVELIITVAIVGILATPALPVARFQVKRKKERELRRDLWEMRDAIDRYKDAADRGGDPDQGGQHGVSAGPADAGGRGRCSGQEGAVPAGDSDRSDDEVDRLGPAVEPG